MRQDVHDVDPAEEMML